jgi:hypothetical protein
VGGRQKTEAPIKTSADRQAPPTGEFYFGASGEFKVGIYTLGKPHGDADEDEPLKRSRDRYDQSRHNRLPFSVTAEERAFPLFNLQR